MPWASSALPSAEIVVSGTASIAQLVELRPFKPDVPGSNPGGGTAAQ